MQYYVIYDIYIYHILYPSTFASLQQSTGELNQIESNQIKSNRNETKTTKPQKYEVNGETRIIMTQRRKLYIAKKISFIGHAIVNKAGGNSFKWDSGSLYPTPAIRFREIQR